MIRFMCPFFFFNHKDFNRKRRSFEIPLLVLACEHSLVVESAGKWVPKEKL